MQVTGPNYTTSYPFRPKIGFLSDSRGEANYTPQYTIVGNVYTPGTTALADGYPSRGVMHFLRLRTRQRFIFTKLENFAIGGFTTPSTISGGTLGAVSGYPATLAPACASDVDAVVVLISTNDRTNSGSPYTAAQSIANLEIIVSSLLNAGKKVILLDELPRGSAGGARLTTPQLEYHIQVHRWFQQQAGRPNVATVDMWPASLNDSSLTLASAACIDPLSALTYDGLHFTPRWADNIALRLQPIIETWYPPQEILPVSNADAYDATNNPRGSINLNAMTAGTGGTVQAPGAGVMTGVIADSHVATLTNGTGLTVALSKETISGVVWQKAVITGTPTSASASLTMRTGSYALTAGQNIQAVGEMQIDAGQTGLREMYLGWNDPAAANVASQHVDGSNGSNQDLYPNVAVAGVLCSPTAAVQQSGNVNCYTTTSFLQSVAVSATVRIRALAIRQIV